MARRTWRALSSTPTLNLAGSLIDSMRSCVNARSLGRVDYTQSGLWKRTLASVNDDEHAVPRERLRSAFDQFRRHVKPLADEVSQSVPGYTDHSIEHCDALWDTASLIAGDQFPMNPAEAFVLGGAFLIHDLAMGLAAYSEGLEGILQTPGWRDLLWAQWPESASELQAIALYDVARNPTWDGLTSPAVKASLTVFLRESHAAEAEDILAREWDLTSGEPFFLLADTELRHWYGELIGKIARSHWLDVLDLEANLPGTRGTPSGLPLDWTVDPIKIACLLRLADAAQIDSRRAHPLHTPFRNPQGESRNHWIFQEKMLHPRLDESRLEFTSSRAFPAHEADAWWLAYDTVKMIHRELQGVDSLCADLGKPRMEARGAAGAEDPLRFSRYVPTSHWSPIDARPHIDDPLGIIGALGGEALYGKRGTVPIRELMANAVDASRARKAAQGPGGMVPAVQVHFDRQENNDILRVRDFGIGMSAETIVDYLCNFGTSGWRSSGFRHQYPGALSSGYTSTGKYGIGFFSVFMIAQRVRVVSRPLHGGWDDTHVLEFTNGIKSRPILRKAESAERLSEVGTEVTLWLDQRLDEPQQLLYSDTQMTSERQVDLVERLAFTSDHAIVLSPLFSTDLQSVTDGDAWEQRPPAEIYDVLHSDPWLMRSREQVKTGRSLFEDLLTPLKGSTGETIGMLAFNPQRNSDWVSPASCYCGGFEAGRLYNFAGVAVGYPVRASRDTFRLDATIEETQSWIHEQWRRISASADFSASDCLQFQWFALGFGVEIADTALAIGTDGLLNAKELEDWLRPRDSFSIANISAQSVITLRGGGFWINTFEGLHRVAADTLGVGYGSRRFADEFPLPNCPELADWNRDVGSIDRLGWWLSNHYDPEGAILRRASRVWAVSIEELLDQMTIAGVDGDFDTRPELEAYEGPPMRTSGLIVTRPGSTPVGKEA